MSAGLPSPDTQLVPHPGHLVPYLQLDLGGWGWGRGKGREADAVGANPAGDPGNYPLLLEVDDSHIVPVDVGDIGMLARRLYHNAMGALACFHRADHGEGRRVNDGDGRAWLLPGALIGRQDILVVGAHIDLNGADAHLDFAYQSACSHVH